MWGWPSGKCAAVASARPGRAATSLTLYGTYPIIECVAIMKLPSG